MPSKLTHEAISEKFLASDAVKFDGLAKFVSDFGPDLVSHDDGLHGVVFGRYNILACMMPAADVAKLVGDLGIARQVAGNVTRTQQ
ncbi:MAG: hypothetical protein ACYC1E_01780 [Propionibacteriaceae bacterium]